MQSLHILYIAKESNSYAIHKPHLIDRYKQSKPNCALSLRAAPFPRNKYYHNTIAPISFPIV